MMTEPECRSRHGFRERPLNLLVTFVVAGLLFAVFAFAPGCAPFSEMQSAKLVGEDRVEVTPNWSQVSFSNDGESSEILTHVGLQLATGVADGTDLRVRYERMDIEGEDGNVYNVLGFGPKFAIERDRSALYLPVGFAFGDNVIDGSKTWQFHPTLLFTVPLGDALEFNPSGKALIPLGDDDLDVMFALNLGAGLSADFESWVIRPEIGFLFNTDTDAEGHFVHYSIGLTLFP